MNLTPTPAAEERVYTFSPKQQETVNAAFAQIAQLEGQIMFFLNHIVREAELPQEQYVFSQDRTGLVKRG